MYHLFSNTESPLLFLSSGNLVSNDNFLHRRRQLDCHVFILILDGLLHITQNDKQTTLSSGQFILLHKNTEHYGHSNSKGKLSYYWVHFNFPNDAYQIINTNKNPYKPIATPQQNQYFIPENNKLKSVHRTTLLFTQLLDFSRRAKHIATNQCNMALSLLLLEISNEAIQYKTPKNRDMPAKVMVIIDWLDVNYHHKLTIHQIATYFDFHPSYLSKLFKQYTGYALVEYIQNIRISAAKNLLHTNTSLTITMVANACGFDDDKYFLRVFKKCVSMTPTQYRNTFSKKKINLN